MALATRPPEPEMSMATTWQFRLSHSFMNDAAICSSNVPLPLSDRLMETVSFSWERIFTPRKSNPTLPKSATQASPPFVHDGSNPHTVTGGLLDHTASWSASYRSRTFVVRSRSLVAPAFGNARTYIQYWKSSAPRVRIWLTQPFRVSMSNGPSSFSDWRLGLSSPSKYKQIAPLSVLHSVSLSNPSVSHPRGNSSRFGMASCHIGPPCSGLFEQETAWY